MAQNPLTEAEMWRDHVEENYREGEVAIHFTSFENPERPWYVYRVGKPKTDPVLVYHGQGVGCGDCLRWVQNHPSLRFADRDRGWVNLVQRQPEARDHNLPLPEAGGGA